MDTSNKQHLIETEGDIIKPVPKEAREISAFFYLLKDETMKTLPSTLTPTWIRCFRKGCRGIISTAIDLDKNELHWECSTCVNNGTITGL